MSSIMYECKCSGCIPICLKGEKCECFESLELEGSSYTWIVLLVSFAVLSILFTVLSVPLAFTYDIMINNDNFNLERRAETAELMQFAWSAIPLTILATIFGYGITKSLRERREF